MEFSLVESHPSGAWMGHPRQIHIFLAFWGELRRKICYYFKRSSFGGVNVTSARHFILSAISSLRILWDEMGLTRKAAVSNQRSAISQNLDSSTALGTANQEAGGRM